MEGFGPKAELSDDQTEPISVPEKRVNIFMQQAEEANKSIDDLRRELHAAEAKELDIKLQMARGEYGGKLRDLSDIAEIIKKLKERISDHKDNVVVRMNYANPNSTEPGPKGFDYLHGDDRKFHDRDKAA